MWEFKVDIANRRTVEIKYYAYDEILAFIGGNFELALRFAGLFMLPFGLIEFVINNSSKLEEIELQIGQARGNLTEEKIGAFQGAIDLRKDFLDHYWFIYLSNFIPNFCLRKCFKKEKREIVKIFD